MATSGSIRPSSNGIYISWSLASQHISPPWSVINVTFGWGFHSSPLDRQLDNGILQVNGSTKYYNGGRIKDYTGDTRDRDYAVWSGQVVINHNSSGNGSFSLYGAMTGYSGHRSEGSGSFSLPNIPQLPSAPGTPSVSGHNDSDPTTAAITWSTPSNVGAGLQRRQILIDTHGNMGGPWVVNNEAGWGNSYNASGLPKGTTLHTAVRAGTAAGWGPWSASATFTTGTTAPSAPGTPTGADIHGSFMTISWSAPSDNGGSVISSYEVQRADNSSFTTNLVSTILPGTSTSMQVTGLNHTKTYYYRVRATNAVAKQGGFSGTASFATIAAAPVPPPAPVVTDRTPATMTVTWSVSPDDGGSPVTGYDIQWSEHPNFDTPSSANTTEQTWVIGNLTASTAYFVRVRAKNAMGIGDWSTPTPSRTTSGARVANGAGDDWIEADVWAAIPGAQGYEWRRCKVITIAG